MEKFLYYNELYLIYKGLLKETNSEIFDLYYGENMTMQEIADYKKISKSRVGLVIKNVQQKLDKYENILHIYQNQEKLNDILNIDDIKIIKDEITKLLKGD